MIDMDYINNWRKYYLIQLAEGKNRGQSRFQVRVHGPPVSPKLKTSILDSHYIYRPLIIKKTESIFEMFEIIY